MSSGTVWNALRHVPMGLLGLVVLLLPLALGGAHPLSVAVSAALLALAFLLQSLDATRRGSRIAIHGFGFLLLSLVVATVMQTIPLPIAMVEWLSPRAAEYYRRVAALLGGEAIAWAPLSLDVPATWLEAARLTAVTFAFLLVHNACVHSEQRAEGVLRLVALSGLGVFLVATLQTLSGQGVWFGLYDPGKSLDYLLVTSTFINENHLAGFLNLTGFVALGLAQHAEEARERIIFGFAFIAAMVGTALSLSRGGVAAAVAGAVLFTWLSMRVQRRTARASQPRAWLLGAVLAMLCVVAVGTYVGMGAGLDLLPGLAELGQDAKIALIGEMPRVMRDFPFTGVGAGALGDVFAQYNEVAPAVEVTHAENIAVDLVVNYGLPLGVILLGWTLFLLIGPFVRAFAHSDSLGAVVGLYALTLQNLADFSFFVSGVAVAAAVVVGAILGLDAGERRQLSPRMAPRRRAPAWAGLAASTAALVLVVKGFSVVRLASDDGVQAVLAERFDAAATDRPAPPLETLHAVARFRPADAHLALMEAVVQLQRGESGGCRAWLDEARWRGPHALAPQLLEARLASVEGRGSDAVTLYADLYTRHWGSREEITAEVRQFLPSGAAIERAVPLEVGEQGLLWVTYWLERHDAAPLAEAVLRARLLRQPDAYELRWELGLLLFERDSPAPEVDYQATQLMARFSDRAGGFLLQGLLFEKQRRFDESLVMFEEAEALEPHNAHALLGVARCLAELGRIDEFREVAGRLRPLVRPPGELRAEFYRVLSKVSQLEGRLDDAVMEMEMAVTAAPRRAGFHARLGELRAATDDASGARAAFERALRIAPTHAQARAGLESLGRFESDSEGF